MVWISALILLWYVWDFPIWYKIGINLLLIVGTPSLSDLVKPYDQYIKDWETLYKKD